MLAMSTENNVDEPSATPSKRVPRKKFLKRKSTVETSEKNPQPAKKKLSKSSKHPYTELRTNRTGDALTIDDAKKLIGWTEEPEGEDWGTEFALKDTFGKKIRLTNNPTNRPLKIAIAKRYTSEFLRKVWKLNLETIVFGESGQLRDGQHRLVGFILAEQQRGINPKEWGYDPLTMECLLGFNVSDDRETADSYDKGQSRSLDDVIYRHQDFAKSISEKEQRKISKTLAVALRLVWIRSGGQVVSSAPHFPHSEALEFFDSHKAILSSVKKIIAWDSGEAGNERLIASHLSLGYAAGLHFLQTKIDKLKADEFWSSFAAGEGLAKGSPVLALRASLAKAKSGTGMQRDAIVGTCVKAWLAFVESKKVTSKDIRLNRTKKGDKFVFSEDPRIGGIDVVKEAPDKLSIQHQILLSTLSKLGKEVTYQELSDLTGLSKALIGRLAYSDDPSSLSSQKLVKVSQYEPEEGERVAPYHIQITPAGKKLI